jgi:hypothetical protein
MKRSENVSLVLMGAAAFAATFGGGMAYFALKPGHAAQPDMQTEAVVDQRCTTRVDGTRDCEPQRRGVAYYFYPRFTSGWLWPSGWSWSSSSGTTRDAALSSNPRSYAPTSSGFPAGSGIQRSGFGSSARGSFRVSGGG